MADLNELRNAAARVAGAADLRDVRLFQLDSTLEQVPTPGRALNYSFDSEVEVQESDNESTVLIVDGSYDVWLRQNDTDEPDDEGPEADGRLIAHVKINLAALYDVPEPHSADFTDEELDAFAKTTGLLTLHPYARELISNLTSRMGLPTLHVGTVRIPLDKRNGDG